MASAEPGNAGHDAVWRNFAGASRRRAGARRQQLTFYREPILGVTSYADAPNGHEYFTLIMDVGGDEFFQIYRFDPRSGTRTLLSDGEKRHGGGLRCDATGEVIFTRVDSDAEGADGLFYQ